VDLFDKDIGPRVKAEMLGARQGYLWSSHLEDDPLPQEDEGRIRVRHSRDGNLKEPERASDFSAARPMLSQLPDHSDEPLNVRRVCSSMLEILQDIRFLDPDPNAIRRPFQPGQVILGDRGENLSSVLQGICRDPALKGQLLGWLRSLTPMDAVDFEFETDLSGRVLLMLVEAAGQRVSALSISDGTLRFLALAAALLTPDTPHLFPGASPFFAKPEMGSVRFQVQKIRRRPWPSAAHVRPASVPARTPRGARTPART